MNELNLFIQKIKAKYTELSHKSWDYSSFYNGALEAFGILHVPKHEKVSEWEDRTGETYPDGRFVWAFSACSEEWYISIRKNITSLYLYDLFVIEPFNHGNPEDK